MFSVRFLLDEFSRFSITLGGGGVHNVKKAINNSEHEERLGLAWWSDFTPFAKPTTSGIKRAVRSRMCVSSCRRSRSRSSAVTVTLVDEYLRLNEPLQPRSIYGQCPCVFLAVTSSEIEAGFVRPALAPWRAFLVLPATVWQVNQLNASPCFNRVLLCILRGCWFSTCLFSAPLT